MAIYVAYASGQGRMSPNLDGSSQTRYPALRYHTAANAFLSIPAVARVGWGIKGTNGAVLKGWVYCLTVCTKLSTEQISECEQIRDWPTCDFFNRIREVKGATRTRLFAISGVEGLKGQPTDEPAIIVFFRGKKQKNELSDGEIIPGSKG